MHNDTTVTPTPPSRKSWLRAGLSALLVLALLYAVAIGAMLARQESLLFYPVKLAADFQINKPEVVERRIEVPGATLSALHFRQPNAKGLIFFLHGNAGNLDIWLPSTDFYRRAGCDLFMIDYRGYGKSTGHIESEVQLHADVRAAWDHIAPHYAGHKLVVYGRSLGSGLAARLSADLSTNRAPDLTVLVSPYRSMAALTAEHYGWVPSWVLRYPMRTDQLIERIRGPLVLVDGERDQLIASHHSDALKALAPHASVARIAGAAHGDIHEFDAYLDALERLLASL